MEEYSSPQKGSNVKDCITGRVMICREGRLISPADPAAGGDSDAGATGDKFAREEEYGGSVLTRGQPGEAGDREVAGGHQNDGKTSADEAGLPFAGPGLTDLQINGVNGVDFNSVSLTPENLLTATQYLLSRGITTFFPTVITNSTGNMCSVLSVIDKACREYPLVESCIGGIHLEGPFISREEGYRGAHPAEHVREADWDLLSGFRDASGDRISIVAVSPEKGKGIDFISRCVSEGIIVTIAHSAAGDHDIGQAVEAGAAMTSHLGNAVPLMLRRHPNVLWDLLACDDLYASIVADGFHLPDSFIRVALRAKAGKVMMVSDATCFAGLMPGVYKTHIGGEVELDERGRLVMKGSGGLLAGAARTLDENVGYMVDRGLADLSGAWAMASTVPRELPGRGSGGNTGEGDLVVFRLYGGRIEPEMVWKSGNLVWKG